MTSITLLALASMCNTLMIAGLIWEIVGLRSRIELLEDAVSC